MHPLRRISCLIVLGFLLLPAQDAWALNLDLGDGELQSPVRDRRGANNVHRDGD